MLLEVLVHSDLTNLERLTCKCKDGLVATYNNRSGQQKSKARKVRIDLILVFFCFMLLYLM